MEVCNDLPYSMWFSIGFEDEGEIISLGWRSLGAGLCENAHMWLLAEGYEGLDMTRVWIHGGDDYQSPNEAYGSGLALCVDRVFETYVVPFADSTCEKRGYGQADHSAFTLWKGAGLRLSSAGFEAF